MPVFNNALAGAAGASGIELGPLTVTRSLRFNSADSSRLSRSPSSVGNLLTWTWSAWVKRSSSGALDHLLSARVSANNYASLYFSTDGALVFAGSKGGNLFNVTTDAFFRDQAAWYHVVVRLDTTQATAANRIKIWVNNVEQTYSSSTYPDQNSNLAINNSTPHYIGISYLLLNAYDGYLAEVNMVDGQAASPTDFGEYVNGVWQPLRYTATVYGTNGFRLDFSTTTSTTTIAEDKSGRNNDFTATNISVSGTGTDSFIDSPMDYTPASGNNGGNYATLNPLDGNPTGLSNGNLVAASANAYPTIIPGSGSWYYEVNGTGYNWDGTRANFTPRAGTHNFGQRPFSGTVPGGRLSVCTTNLAASGVTDGSTAFDVVTYSGNSSTNTFNVGFGSDFVWIKSRSNALDSQVFDRVRGVNRTLSANTTTLETTATNSLTSFDSDGFTLGSDPNNNVNDTGKTYVAWTWEAGTSFTNTANANGASISSSGYRSPTNGFSIVSYTGNYTNNATVYHGLNAVPDFIIVKNRDLTNTDWPVYHSVYNASTEDCLYLSTGGTGSSTARWRTDSGTQFSTNTFGLARKDDINGAGEDHIAYCWTTIPGFSSFSSYEGNGNTNGPFVNTGFLPRWVMIKNIDASGGWIIFDTQRGATNVIGPVLTASLSLAEGNAPYIDILSNGFKLRSTDSSLNTNANTYIYAAFADRPFKTARAR
jgi:hypothetical protein